MVIPARRIPSVLIVLAVVLAAPSVLAVNQIVRDCLEGQNHLSPGACTGTGHPSVAGFYQVRVDRSAETCSATTCSDSSEACSSDSQCKDFDRIEIPYDQTKGTMLVNIVSGAGWTAAAEPSNYRWVLSGPPTQYLEYAIELAGTVNTVGPTIKDSGNDLAISGDEDVPSILEPTPAVSMPSLVLLVAVVLATGLFLIGRRHRGGAAWA